MQTRARSVQYEVNGIGNALVDCLALVSDEFLARNGIRKGVMALVDTPGTEQILIENADGYTRVGGGSAANTLVGISHLGGKTCFTGKVADDPNGRFYREDLAASGVIFKAGTGEGVTGTCVSLITPDGQRSMLTHLGVSGDLTREDIDEDVIAASAYLYVEGYQWSAAKARDASVHAMELAKKHGTRVALTYSDPLMAKHFRDDFWSVTREYVDLLFCNEDEGCAVAETSDRHRAARVLNSICEMVCLTTAADGAIVAERGVITETPATLVEQVVDTTGAGDLYAAGVLHSLVRGDDLIVASHTGARLAAAVIARIGARLT
jgi:sugar/nucleoside kinase (ribokinase family)